MKCSLKKMIYNIETDVTEQEAFLKKQHGLIKESLKGFKDILARITVLKCVAKILKVPTDEIGDVEDRGNKEPLLDQETIEATGLAILGGTIKLSD